jgi:cysteine desulfurase / selenocysteine lyase
MSIDTGRLREDFPILHQEVHGKPLVYLDSAATTQKPRQVIDALVRYYEQDNANIHRGIHALAVRATHQYEAVRARVAGFIGARDPHGIVFTRNTTESLNLVARAWGDEHVSSGDEIVLSMMEHHSNIVPWQLLARRKGATLRYANVDDAGYLDIDHLRSLITPKTRVVSITHASNVLGTITPIAEIAEMAHAVGALLVVDGAQSVPHMPVNVDTLGCDVLAFSAHKMLGPTGVGVLWANPRFLEQTEPFLGGGEMISIVREDGSTWAEVPHKFEAGTPNIGDVIAFSAAIDYLETLGMSAVRDHERELTAYAIDRLSTIPGVAVHGPKDPDHRGGAVSFSMAEAHPHDISTIVDTQGVAIRAGHHCAQLLMRRLGVAATTRASLYIYNEAREIDVLVDALQEVRRVFGHAGTRSAV